MMKKRIVSFSLVLLIVSMLIPFGAAAAGKMTIKAGSVKASLKPGDTVKVPVSFADNPTYEYGYVRASWDESALVLKSVEYTKLAPMQSSAAPITSKGNYKVSFGDMMTYEPFKGDGTAFTLVFTIADGAKAGTYPINLSESEVYDFDINDIPSETKNGEVTLSGSGASSDKTDKTDKKDKTESSNNTNKSDSKNGSSSNQSSQSPDKQQPVKDGRLNVETGSVTAESKKGEEVKLPVSFSQNTGYAYGYLDFTWDKNAFKLKDVEYTKLAPALGGVQQSDGSAKISFGSQNGLMTGTGTAFTLVFETTDKVQAKSYTVKLSGSEIYDSDINLLHTSVADGEIVLTKNGKTSEKSNNGGNSSNSCAGGHSWDSGKVVKAPTCTEQGERRFTCRNNPEHTKTEAIPATGHKLRKAKDENGKPCYECEVCGARFADSTERIQIGAPKDGNTADKKTDATVSQPDDPSGKSGSLIPLWITLMVLSAAGFAAAAVIGKRRKTGKEE